jgi:2-keto-4-pentenoate hydratase
MRAPKEPDSVVDVDALATHLYGLRHGAQFNPDLTEPLADAADVDLALTAQDRVLDRWLDAGDAIGGWKVGLTSGNGRDALGAGIRPYGYILSSRVYETQSRVELPQFGACQIEPEFCLTLGADLSGADASYEDARASVSQISAGFEINEMRLPPTTSTHVAIADGLGNWGIVVGGVAHPAPQSLTDTTCSVYRDGSHVGSFCPGDTMDDPFLTLRRLCKTLSARGCGLRAGQRVITGSFSKHVVDGPGTWTANFEGVGTVEVTFEAAP